MEPGTFPSPEGPGEGGGMIAGGDTPKEGVKIAVILDEYNHRRPRIFQGSLRNHGRLSKHGGCHAWGTPRRGKESRSNDDGWCREREQRGAGRGMCVEAVCGAAVRQSELLTSKQ